jgi:hypothetical protein
MIFRYIRIGFGGLVVACWSLVPKFAGSNPVEDVGFLRAKKILSAPSFGGEVKPSVPCRRFAACKRSLNGVKVIFSAKLPDNILAYSSVFLASWQTSGHLVAKVGTSKRGGKQLQTTPKICLGCSIPEPYQSPDWALVSAQTGPRAEYL